MSPDGCRVKGTLEKLSGVAQCGDIHRNEDGTLEFSYEGGTEVWWDAAETVERLNSDTLKMETVFVDEDGEEWLASELVETPEEEEPDGA